MTTVLVCATPEVESDLCHTLFWRDDLERYVADRAEDAGTLALATEPHIVVVDLAMRGADRLIVGLRNQNLPHPVAIVALSHDPSDVEDNEEASGGVDTVLSLPSSPAWDESLVEVLQVPTRKQARFDVHFDVVSMLRAKPGSHRGLVLNISAGGLLVECAGPADPSGGRRDLEPSHTRLAQAGRGPRPRRAHSRRGADGPALRGLRGGRRRERAALPRDAGRPAVSARLAQALDPAGLADLLLQGAAFLARLVDLVARAGAAAAAWPGRRSSPLPGPGR